MFNYSKLRLFTQVVHSLRFPPSDKPYAIIYFPENGLLLDDTFNRLGIRRVDIRTVVVPYSKYPLIRLTSKMRMEFKQLGLFAFKDIQPNMLGRSLYIDFSYYLQTLDLKFKPTNYRARYGSLAKSFLFQQISRVAGTHRIVLLYAIDLNKGLPNFINRKSYIFLEMLRDIKDIPLPFDDLLFAKISSGSCEYRLLVKEKNFVFTRIISMFRTLKSSELPEEEEEENVSKATEKVINVSKTDDEVKSTIDKPQVKDAIKNLMTSDKQLATDVADEEITPNKAKDLVIRSVLYSTSGDKDKARRIASNIPVDKQNTAIKVLDKEMVDEVLKPEPVQSTTDVEVIQVSDPNQLVDKKVPTHVFAKRQIDFQQNLKKDLFRSFQVLGGKDVPITIISLEIIDFPSRKGEINASDVSLVRVKLRDKFGNIHIVEFQIPKIDPNTGTFRVNGRRKCLINQLVICPISFPKKFDSRFESSYSRFHIQSKKGRKNYLLIYIGSFRLPLLVLLGYFLGLNKVEITYKFTHSIVDSMVKNAPCIKISKKQYVLFKGIDSELKKELITGFEIIKPDMFNISEEFGTKKYFEELIIALTKTRNSVWVIQQILENIVDPVARQVLINQQLPSELPDIMTYMTQKVIEGYEQNRNDLHNQRIRNSEVIVHLVQKQILAAYTDYRKQVLAGNEKVTLTINPSKVLRDFINSEIVTDMEYANPAEEMATLTRLSPVGSQVGGIPSKMAISTQARNVHQSYFGNIDPVDTPEGGNVGIVQQLTVGAAITSARGLFGVKDILNKEASGILSTSAAMIPFVENNEGARTLMACNQQRQVVPIESPDVPLVQTGYESLLTNVLSDNFVKKAPCNGTIEKVTSDYIEMSCSPRRERIEISPRSLRSGSGKNSLSIFKPTVKPGQKVKMNSIIAEGSCISNGMIANGKTLLVAVMPYGGYNFEDGIMMSNSVFQNNKFNSIHLVTEEFELLANDKLTYIADIGSYVKKGEPIVKKMAGELAELLGGAIEEEESSKEVIGGELILKSPGGIIVDIDVYCNSDKKKFPLLEKFITRTNRRSGVDKGYSISGRHISGALIVIKIKQTMKIEVGDKFCGRYGNKGVVSIIQDESMMPRTPWGEHVEMVINPLGIINRMNIGQVYELYCGLIAKTLGGKLVNLGTSKEKGLALIKSVITILDGTKNKMYSNNILSGVSKMSASRYSKMIEQVKFIKGFPILIPPFKSPKLSAIQQCLKVLGLQTGYQLFLPEFSTNTNKKVPVGYMYITKLEHMANMKIHARSIGSYTSKTLQPPAGKAREGGQRMGEQESWSLLSSNAPTVLSEFFGPLSDDMKTKQEIISDIVTGGEAKFRQPKISPSRELLAAYFTGLGITEQ